MGRVVEERAAMAESMQGRRRHRLLRRAGLVVGVVGASGVSLALLVTLGLAWAAGSVPSWWEGARLPQADGSSASGNATRTPGDLGAQVEHDALGALSAARRVAERSETGWRSEPWQMVLDQASMSAWLEQRLAGWMRSRGVAWEERVTETRAWIEPAGAAGATLRVGVRLRGVPGEPIVSARVVLEVREGALWGRAQNVRVGRVGVPTSEALGRLGLGEMAEVGRALTGDGPMVPEPVIRLDDGRRARLLGLESREHRGAQGNPGGAEVVMTWRTEGGG